MRRAAALFAALVLFAAIPAAASGQAITVDELETWSGMMDRFRYGPEGCPILVGNVQDILGGIVAAAGSDTDTNWEWVEELGRGVAGNTYYDAHPRTGEIRWDSENRPSTELSEAERDRSPENEFLWGVAHEAMHWVTPVEVRNGEIVDEHYGPDWERLDECFLGPA